MLEIIFIGSLNLGSIPDDGETMKNLFLRNALSPHVGKIIKIDVRNRPARFLYLIKLLVCLLLNRNAKIVLSASSFVSNKLLKLIYKLGWEGESIYYWVVGGCFADYVEERKLDIKYYKHLAKIIVQGESMKRKLNSLGLNNVIYLPNSKPIKYIPQKQKKTDNFLRFVFLSRIIPEKGVSYIIDAANQLCMKGYKNFIIDFYGKIESSYKKEFTNLLNSNNRLSYKGFLNLDNNGYDTLANYDIMLFPTFWQGEGFPGVIIDAYIAGLPVIASNWNLNTDVVKNEETGIIIPVHNTEALTQQMERILLGEINIERLSSNSQKEALKYEVNNVINKDLLESIKLI